MAAIAHNLPETLAAAQPRVGNTRFIAVDGRGGSGKSTLAAWLSGRLNASVIKTDDFASWDNQLDWWPLVVERVFVPIQQGATTLSYPRSSWWEHHRPDPVVGQPVTPVMILEGVSASRTEFSGYVSVSLFVETPKELCLHRGVERDLATGKSREALEEMWKDWLREEDLYMQRDDPRSRATLVVDGARPFEDQIEIGVAKL